MSERLSLKELLQNDQLKGDAEKLLQKYQPGVTPEGTVNRLLGSEKITKAIDNAVQGGPARKKD